MENRPGLSNGQIRLLKPEMPYIFYAVYDCNSYQGCLSRDLAFIEQLFNDQLISRTIFKFKGLI